MDSTKAAVAATGLLAAAVRAEESRRDDPLFTDPFAERLAGDDGRRLLADAVAATGQSPAEIAIRTRFFDEALLGAQADGASQVVILAAGMDARAYRLPWRPGATVYEVDQPEVIATKDRRLAGAPARCRRVPVGIDLADDWPKALLGQGFTSSAKTAWLVEGLLQYLDAPAVDTLFARVDTLSAPGDVLLYNVIGRALLEAPFLQSTRQFMRRLGAPWTFGTDAPAALVERHGWSAVVTDVAEPGTRWHRWEHPVVPLDVPGVPRGYFVIAVKEGLNTA
ncbi:SAM-dependent methyltransferase [Mycobacterium terramassiliense]|uniref:S-adenosyl-L-methionine-dependent methyltransferase n=1 Tax=Mycobacterium terramassiliense TaxID=1841859 RepID=A0A2U3N7D4_9MYCO|nr:SAM-dependent methyltransferase [Mycobacterium terramassiliense]SPM27314.1 methyltransferase [Mycobacterium terramassiliense]